MQKGRPKRALFLYVKEQRGRGISRKGVGAPLKEECLKNKGRGHAPNLARLIESRLEQREGKAFVNVKVRTMAAGAEAGMG